MSIFEKATRTKLKFKAANGVISTEDLWDLSLAQLDNIAKGLRKELRDEDDSFIDDKKANTQLELKFEIVKHIITTRLEERDAQNTSREKAAKKQQLLEVLEQRRAASLQNLTEAEILKELADL